MKSKKPPGGERVYIRDNIGTVLSDSEYCKIGADEGWLIYESYFEDSYLTIHHTYRLIGEPVRSRTKPKTTPPQVKKKPKKTRFIRHWD